MASEQKPVSEGCSALSVMLLNHFKTPSSSDAAEHPQNAPF